jgi:phosphatidylinositol alpha-1,6-mannosyltransferase
VIDEGTAATVTDPRLADFPATLLALVDRGVPDDGIAYVGLLLERALTQLSPWLRTITVFPDVEGHADPTLLERGLFKARLVRGSRRADLVMFNHLGVATAEVTLPARLRRPFAVFVHGSEAWSPDIEPARKRALTDARLLIANSEHTARRVHESYPEAPVPVVCPLSLLPDPPSGSIDGALVSSVTSRTIVIAGRMNDTERHKGHEDLLDAWPTVLARRPDARLAVVGRGNDVKRLEAKSNALGLAGSVRFAGYVSDATLDAMLLRAGGFALPSKGEASALGYLRAMRAAVPCIGGADDAGREVIEDGVTGILVPSEDRDALSRAVIDLLGDTERRRRMGEAGRARFEEHFGFELFVERLRSVVLNARPRSPGASVA